MNERYFFFFAIFSAFLSISYSHLYNIAELSKISELPIAWENLLNYINEVDRNFEDDSDDLLDDINVLRAQENLHTVMDTFLNKVKILKDDIVNKVVHEAQDVVDVNKEILGDLVKIFKDITKKVKNGAQIVDIVEVTKDIVQYTNLTLGNLYKNDINNKKQANQVYKKIKEEITKGENGLRQDEAEKEDLRKYLAVINKQMNFLGSDLKVIVQKAKDIRKVMDEIIKMKPMLEIKFKQNKVQKIL